MHRTLTSSFLAIVLLSLLPVACDGGGGDGGTPEDTSPPSGTAGAPVATAAGSDTGEINTGTATLSCVEGVASVSVNLDERLEVDATLVIAPVSGYEDGTPVPAGEPQFFNLPADSSAIAVALPPEAVEGEVAELHVGIVAEEDGEQIESGTILLDVSDAECVGG
jgi:hypothetical protein